MTEIQREFAYAKAQGWLPLFAQAGSLYNFTPALLMGIASRETNMKNIQGDFQGGIYHGYGLMQIDIGSYPDFCRSGDWRDVAKGIHMGAMVLNSKQVQIHEGVGRRIEVKSTVFTGAKLSDADFNRTAVAAYNAGLWAYYGMSVRGNPDLYTTGHDYSADVINRTKQFADCLAAEKVA